LSKEDSKPSPARKAAAWLMKVLDHFASFEDRRKAFVSSASLGFSVPTELQAYVYGASRPPVSLPHPPSDTYTAKNIRAIIPEKARKEPTAEDHKSAKKFYKNGQMRNENSLN